MTKHASTAHWSSKQRRYVNTHGFAALTLAAVPTNSASNCRHSTTM